MSKRTMLLAIGAAALLSACSSHEEKLCRASVTESLMNPETAQISDFRQYTDEEVKTNEYLKSLPEIIEGTVPQKGASYYRLKVRAEGELGNKITKFNFCGVDAKRTMCFCVPSS